MSTMTMIGSFRLGALLCLAIACLTLPSAQAGDIGSEPANFSGEFDHRTGVLTLTWDAPAGFTAPTGYEVYRDGELLGTTTQSIFVDDLSEWAGGTHAYHAVAIWGMAEGNPSAPFAVSLLGVPAGSSPCPIVGISTYTHSPFIAYGINQECLPV